MAGTRFPSLSAHGRKFNAGNGLAAISFATNDYLSKTPVGRWLAGIAGTQGDSSDNHALHLAWVSFPQIQLSHDGLPTGMRAKALKGGKLAGRRRGNNKIQPSNPWPDNTAHIRCGLAHSRTAEPQGKLSSLP